VHITNLDERAQNAHLRIGIGMTAVALILGVTLERLGTGGAAHFLLAPFFFFGAYGMGSAMNQTCGISAIFGRRRCEARTEPIADRAELGALRKRGATVIAASVAFAIGASALMAVAR
jgi:hypothetical protein